MFKILKKFTAEKFIVYGFGINKKEDNILFKEFSEKGFADDLANSKAVITNGGFSLMSEAVFLHKPVLSIPVKKHYEQINNAVYLQKEGYGAFYEQLTRKNLKSFLMNLPKYRKNLRRYKQMNNEEAFRKIDKTINSLKP